MRIQSSLFVLSSSAICLALAVTGCSDDGDSATGTTTGSGGSTATTTAGAGGAGTGGSTSSGGGMGPVCNAPSPEHPGLELAVGQITAEISDQFGNPAADVPGDLCGVNICAVYGQTDADGFYDEDAMGADIVDPALLYGAGYDFAKMAAPITEASVAFDAINIIRLPSFAEGVPLVAGEDATSEGVTLSVPGGANIKFDNIVYPDDAQKVFRAAVVDASTVNLPAVDPALGLEVIIAMSPIDTQICPAAQLTFPNLVQWAEGTKVDLYLHGSALFNHYAPYGQWAKITTATVTAEGVVSDDGIELLGVYGAVAQL